MRKDTWVSTVPQVCLEPFAEVGLVTKEEPVWESFSEDEPEPAPPKKKPAVNVAKGKPGKAGQGNIMSFFGKK